jgi:hypothetical protein
MASIDQPPTPTLSTGVPSTLGNWYALSKAVFGEHSSPTLFLKEKLDEQGADEPVIADERQVLQALLAMAVGGESEEKSLIDGETINGVPVTEEQIQEWADEAHGRSTD